MPYPVKIEGHEYQHIELVPAGFTSPTKLLVNGQPAPKGPKRDQFMITGSDGRETIVTLKAAAMFEPIPQLVVNGKTIQVVEPLKWYQWVWIAWPILLLFLGGALGGLAGGLATVINMRVFRTDMEGLLKYLMTGLISIIAIVFYFAGALALQMLLR
jgi:hypothetical protein